MAPLLDISDGDFERAKKLLEAGNVKYSIPLNNGSGRVYVPSIDLFVSEGTTPAVGNLSLYYFTKFLLHARDNLPEIYEEITNSQLEPRNEYTSTFFRERKDGLWVFTHQWDSGERLDEDTLMEEKMVSMDSWLENPTRQGLPRRDIEEGKLNYYPPKGGTLAAFYSFSPHVVLTCSRRDPKSAFTRVRTAEPSEQTYFDFSH